MRLNKLRILWQDRNVTGDGEIEPSERRFRTWVLAIAALVGPPLVFLLYYKVMFNGLWVPDALDYAQLGRHLHGGHGFITSVIRPLGLNNDITDLTRQPDLVHGPLYPSILALAFGVMGAKDAVVAWVAGLFYLLTIPLLYRLATRVFNRAVAMIAVLFFTFNALMLEYAYQGLPNTLEIFLSTWLLLVMYNVAAYIRDREGTRDLKLPRGQLITGGILLALLYLTDTIFLWFVPVAVAWLFVICAPFGKRRWNAVMMFAGWFAIFALPLMVRYFRLGVNPFFGLRISEVWMDTPNHYSGDSAYRLMPNELIPSIGLFKAVTTKILLGVGGIIEGFPGISGVWILAFVLPSLLFRFSDPAAHKLRQILMLFFMSILVGVLLFGVNVNNKMQLFVVTTPVMLAFAVAYLVHLVSQAQLSRTGRSMVGLLLAIAVLLPVFNTMFMKDRRNIALDVTHEATAAKGFNLITKKGDAVFSDAPQIVAWYADLPAIWIPQNDVKIKALRRRFPSARYLFMTDRVASMGEEWRPIYLGVARYNEQYTAWKNGSPMPLPAPPGVPHIPETDDRFLNALEGFVSVPPVKGGKKVAIMASSGPPGAAAQANGSGVQQPTQNADNRTP